MKKKGIISSFLVRLKFSAMMALNGVTSNLLRTFLTVLGIAIGVAAVVSLMGIGEGARRAVVAQFESLGQNVIIIKANFNEYNFATNEAAELKERVEGIEYTTPVVYTIDSTTKSKKIAMRWRRNDFSLEVLGVNNNYPAIRDHKLMSGNFFTSLHVKQNAPVVVLGYNVAKSFLNGRSPVGHIMKIAGINYRIVGVMAPKGEGNGDGIDDKVIIPYTSAMRISGTKDITEIWAKSNSSKDADFAMLQLGRIFTRKIKGTTINPNKGTDGVDGGTTGEGGVDVPAPPIENPGEPENPENPKEENIFTKGEEPITITSLNQMVEQADQANRVMSLLLGGIAAVSLLVGGIGIMNIMLVAVTERTGEIGVRRALGAKQEDLLIQFLLEAIYVSIIGCLVGVIMGAFAIDLASKYGLDAVISSQSIKIAIGVALSSGLLFGVYPAINASSLPPVEALKRS